MNYDHTCPDNSGFELFTYSDGWTLGRFTGLTGLTLVVHAVTTRDAPRFGSDPTTPDSRTSAALLVKSLGLEDVAWCRQVHGDQVLVTASGGLKGSGDALITDVPGLGLMCRSADCPLVLLAAPHNNATPELAPAGSGWVVGVAHASWRSTVAGIVGKTIMRMQKEYGIAPHLLRAAICPSAGPCCYEVGDEVRQAGLAKLGSQAEEFFRQHNDRFIFDLWAANVDQMLQTGVQAKNIQTSGICTLCHNNLFPSYRREGEKAARFAAVIGVLG